MLDHRKKQIHFQVLEILLNTEVLKSTCSFFSAPHMAAVTRPVRHGFGVRGSMSPPTKQKVLILMRGLPGSGKTFLAQLILKIKTPKSIHI